MTKLFNKTQLKELTLQNRVVMAPMTRARSSQPGNVPNDMMATYYRQRASAGLIITEATQISDDSQGYSFTPGVYTDAQIEGWKASNQSSQRTRRSSILSALACRPRVSPDVSKGRTADCTVSFSSNRNSGVDF